MNKNRSLQYRNLEQLLRDSLGASLPPLGDFVKRFSRPIPQPYLAPAYTWDKKLDRLTISVTSSSYIITYIARWTWATLNVFAIVKKLSLNHQTVKRITWNFAQSPDCYDGDYFSVSNLENRELQCCHVLIFSILNNDPKLSWHSRITLRGAETCLTWYDEGPEIYLLYEFCLDTIMWGDCKLSPMFVVWKSCAADRRWAEDKNRLSIAGLSTCCLTENLLLSLFLFIEGFG